MSVPFSYVSMQPGWRSAAVPVNVVEQHDFNAAQFPPLLLLLPPVLLLELLLLLPALTFVQ
jgi:hypothetical protein